MQKANQNPSGAQPEWLPWHVEPDAVHGASIRDAKGNQVVAHVYDEENAVIIVSAVKVTALRAQKFLPTSVKAWPRSEHFWIFYQLLTT